MSSGHDSLIAVQGVEKAYGATRALRGVDLEVARGEVFALLGPNGAGKTTLIEILEGYRVRTSGDVRVLGEDPASASRAWRARIGMVLQSTTVFDQLTPAEVVSQFASYFPAPLPAAEVLHAVGLTEKRDVRMRKLSGGQKRRADLAVGLVGDPELIFLDEPTTGLDPEGRRQLWEVIRGFAARGKTVMLTTHYLDEAEQLADRVGVIVGGRLVALGPPGALGGRAGAPATVRFACEGALAGQPIPAVPGNVVVEGQVVSVLTSHPTAVLRELTAWAAAAGCDELPGLVVTRPSLEDVYLQLVRAEDRDVLGGAA
ncbi:MAG: ABC transporter ATP-binding protein [Dehalococcoidia bacterium]